MTRLSVLPSLALLLLAPARCLGLSAKRVDVLVAGGGPAGLAAAASLAKAGLSVTVVEKREAASEFEPQRAYLYLLDRWRRSAPLHAARTAP